MPRINHNIPAMITGNALADVGRQMSSSLEKLSTGLRINRASDDAAGLSVSEQLRTQVNGLAMGNRNVQDGTALVNIADGALNESEAMLQRMRELSIQASNDTLTSTERGYIQDEFDLLRQEIDRIVGGTQYNGQALLNGGTVWSNGGVIHVGPNNDPIMDVILITIPAINTTALGVSITDTVYVTSQIDATNAISALDAALHSVNTQRAVLGALTNRLGHALTNQENQQTNMSAAESVIRDTDFASETTLFTRNQILQQSATAMLAQANTLPQSILTLLKG